MPAIHAYRHFVDVGGLMSYGIDVSNLSRVAANDIDLILKGAKPSEHSIPAADQARVDHQCDGCEGARPDDPALATRPRRRGGRMMSASWHIAAPDLCDGTSAVGESRHRIPRRIRWSTD